MLALTDHVYKEPLALIASIIVLSIAEAAGTVYIGNTLKYILREAVYSVRTTISASSLLGALYGSLILLTPAPSMILAASFLAAASSTLILYRRMTAISTRITHYLQDSRER